MNFVEKCDVCQKQVDLSLKTKTELQNVPIETAVMKQVGIDACNLPKVYGFCSLVVYIDYFSKWSEAKPIQDKTAPTIAKFSYELICRHGCFSIQINDQGREFVNSVSDELHRLTGGKQRITSAKVEHNISQAQQKQKRDYDRRHQSSNVISVRDKVLLINNKRNDRKGGKFTFKWLGPFVVKALSPKGLATLQNLKSAKALKNKYNKVQLKHYVDGNDVIVDQSNISEEKPIIHEPNDEKPADTTNDENSPVPLEHEDIDINKKSFFSLIPDELIEEIPLASLKSSSHVKETYQSIMGTCKKFRLIIKKKGKLCFLKFM